MYELFYNFLIEELLVSYFKQADIETADKFYIVIEDAELRRDFYKMLKSSEFTESYHLCFPGYEKYGIASKPYDTVVFNCCKNNVKILVSGCDDTNDGFQTKIRNSIGNVGNPITDMATLFILPGTNAIETLLSSGHNLQEKPYPLSIENITRVINSKIDTIINEIEKTYLKNHIEKLKGLEDYTSLFDFAPILSILQKKSIKGSFNELGAFEDSEIYDMFFEASDVQNRIKDNTDAYAIISDIMGEAYEQDQYNRLRKYIDNKLARKITNGVVDWKRIDYREIRKSHQDCIANAVLRRPSIQLQGLTNAELVTNQKGTDKKSKTYVIVCTQQDESPRLKVTFNKDLKDYSHNGDASISGCNMIFTIDNNLSRDSVGDDKNNHEIIILKLETSNVFHDIEHFFKIDYKGNIIVDVPDSMEYARIGTGTKELKYDKLSPIELDDNTFFRIEFDQNSVEEPSIPFKFGKKIVTINFKYKGVKTPTLPPTTIVNTVWGNEEGGYTYEGDEGEITGTIAGPQGPVYVHERFRKLLNYEKYMVDGGINHIRIENNEFSGEQTIVNSPVDVAPDITTALQNIFNYFRVHNTLPSLTRPNDTLVQLYKEYLKHVHEQIANIPTDSGLSNDIMNIARLGVVERIDGSIMLSPFHPLMIAYSLELNDLVDASVTRKVMDELSPLHLMPFIYFGKNVLKAVNSTETEDLLTWVVYDNAQKIRHLYGSKSTAKLVADKLKKFISNFKYYFPDLDCPLRISAIGLSQSVDVVRGMVDFILSSRKNGNVQRLELHEYVDDMLMETFFEKINRLSTRDNISSLFDQHNFGVSDNELNEVIRLLFNRVSYYKHTFKESRMMSGYSHLTFYKIDTGTVFSPIPSNQLRTETSLNGLVSIPSTCLNDNHQYLMGFGTRGLKDKKSQLYQMATDLNSLYAGLENGGLKSYSHNQCTAKIYSFDDSDFLEDVYKNSTWVTFINPDVDIDFFYKQNLYVVHYVEQHSISARLESITVTKHIKQYDNMLFNSLQTFKSVIGTSEDFSRKMISYFNCLNGKWLLDVVNKPELIAREKMSLVATCFVMQHFMQRTDNTIWVPLALDDIVKSTGSGGGKMDGILTKKDLGIEGPLSDDLLMIGFQITADGFVNLYFYPVEVKVLSNDSVEKGEMQVANYYNKIIKAVLLSNNSFNQQVYRVFFASQFLSNAEKMKSNDLLSDEDYGLIDSYRYELLNNKFSICEDLPEEIGKAALVVYSNATAKSLNTEWVEGVPVCHIRMMESDCYRIVTNPDTDLLSFVEQSAIIVSDTLTEETQTDGTDMLKAITVIDADSLLSELPKTSQEEVVPEGEKTYSSNSEEDNDEEPKQMLIKIGVTKRENDVTIEPNNPRVVSHPNIGITGIMGTGKTQLVRSIIAQFSKEKESNVGERPIGMLVFDYKGDYNDDAFIEKVGGTCTFYDIPFNPLKLLKTKKNVMQNLPAITAEAIADSLAKAFGAGAVQQAKMKQVIIETYEDFGITADFTTWDKPAPTINDVIERYLAKYDATDTVYSYFSSMNNYKIFSSKPESCVSIFEWMDRVRVIDLTEINSDSVKRVVVSLILDVLNKEMLLLGASKTDSEGRRELRAMIVVDEAHQFMQRDFNAMEQILRQGRAFGVGMVLSSQNIGDFKTKNNDYTNYVASWILHHVNSVSKQDLVSVFGATDKYIQQYMDYINNAQIFESIAKIGIDNACSMHDYPYFELIKQDERFKPKELSLFD